MKKQEILKHYDEFFRDFFVGFSCLNQIETGFGKVLVMQPGEEGAKLSQCNLTSNWSHEEILNTLENIADRWQTQPMLYFLPTWKGDVEAFKAYAKTRGYEFKQNIPDYIVTKEAFSPVEYGDYRFEEAQANQADQFAEVFARCFNPHPLRAMRVKYEVERSMNRVENKFVFAKDDQGHITGIGAYAFNENFSYYHMIGVLPEYRGQGISKQIISFICQELFNQGHGFVMTAVDTQNEPSLKAKKAIGAEHFADCELWTKG